jgi:hypothetical protein
MVFLNAASLMPLLLRLKPLVQVPVNALQENGQAFNTHNTVNPEK